MVQDRATVVETTSAPGRATDSNITWAANDDGVLGPGEAIVGDVLARRLALGILDTNPEFVISGRTVRLVGVLEESDTGTAGGSVFVLPETVNHLEPASASDIYVRTVPGAAPQVAERLKKLVDPYDALDLTIDPVLGADAFQGKLEANVAVSLQVLAVVAGLAGLVGVVFVNVLGVNSRIAEFGVRRAFGARRSELVGLVLGESTVVGALGALIGLAIGFTAVMVVTAVARWQPVFDPALLFVPLVGSLAFGLLGGLPPAIAAGRVQPADAVRS